MAPFAVASSLDVEIFAKKNDLNFRWFPVQKTFFLESPKDTFKFALEIPYYSHNGKPQKLNEIPQLKEGHLYLDSLDLYALTPQIKSSSSSVSSSSQALSSSSVIEQKKEARLGNKNENAGTREVKTIVIDPGHGGKDSGALGKKSQEKDIVLAVAKLLQKELAKEGFNVKLTRNKDVFVELGERANLANKWDGDLFLSLHCNAIDSSEERKKKIQGYHFYVLRAPESEEDKAIARRENKVATLYGEKNAKEELTPIEWFKLEARLEKYKQNSYMITEKLLNSFEGGKIKKLSGGVGGAGFMVLVGALMPAVLIELGFISNPEDEAYMMTKKGQEDLAKRISEAVKMYKDAVHAYLETLQ